MTCERHVVALPPPLASSRSFHDASSRLIDVARAEQRRRRALAIQIVDAAITVASIAGLPDCGRKVVEAAFGMRSTTSTCGAVTGVATSPWKAS
eukprot:CAMPEP_0185173644 /NCGR_PEP_ID=MMETSP1139-20130426/23832_1 /TAXON_ID=298111 /ORGANISM="Pavlova sp., Strain CCMP459" /LENGTH=93 /DNA_ID=CAMNT_0027739341 /DNA_START=325 /DNA_END=604 /DNA_ORIENTATION=-